VVVHGTTVCNTAILMWAAYGSSHNLKCLDVTALLDATVLQILTGWTSWHAARVTTACTTGDWGM
jgi:hypothetical protein